MAKRPSSTSLRSALQSVSSAALYGEALAAQILRDFLDHLFDHFARPSLIVAENRDGGLTSFFPRKRQRQPAEFFEYLLAISEECRGGGRIESIELEHVRLLRESEAFGTRVRPQWRVFVDGVYDLYVPIRPFPELANEPARVYLIFGKYCRKVGGCVESLDAWAAGLASTSNNDIQVLPQVRPETRLRQLERLRQLAHELPSLSDNDLKLVEAAVVEDVRLLARFLGRSFAASNYLREESLVEQVLLEDPSIDVTEAELWTSVEGALQTVLDRLELTAAGVYFADYRDYTYLRRVAAVQRGSVIREVLQFPSFDAFSRVADSRWVTLPGAGDLVWLKPNVLVGTPAAIIFARELRISHLVVIALGMPRERRLDPESKASLWELVNTRLFPHIERAFAAIDLDQLLAEAGHLLGRSVGTVKSAAQSLRDIVHDITSTRDLGDLYHEYQVADWAIETNVMKLDLLRQNLYELANTRPGNPSDLLLEDEDAVSLRVVDLRRVLDNLRGLLDAEARRGNRIVHYALVPPSAPVKAQEGALKAVVLNLWDNALKFSYNHTIITLSLTIRGEQVVFSIEDVGLGVPHDELRAVFRPRFRSRLIDETSSRQKQGLGLGLSYCRRKVEHNFGGAIELRSRPEKSRGDERFEGDAWTTTVVVCLPLVQEGGSAVGPG